jgi:hypothetical protein
MTMKRDPADALRDYDEVAKVLPFAAISMLAHDLATALRQTLAERDRLQEQRSQACRNQATAETRLRGAEAHLYLLWNAAGSAANDAEACALRGPHATVLSSNLMDDLQKALRFIKSERESAAYDKEP